jgi:hypothetical protein
MIEDNYRDMISKVAATSFVTAVEVAVMSGQNSISLVAWLHCQPTQVLVPEHIQIMYMIN